MNITIVGGSNGVLKHSYAVKLKNQGYNVNNKAIGATNSIYSLVQLHKTNILDSTDVLIYEYFVNDNNHYFAGVNNVERVRKTLIDIVNLCHTTKTRLMFIFIYNKSHVTKNKYDASEMYKMYKQFVASYDIFHIDVLELLSKNPGSLGKYHESNSHLSSHGMDILTNEIIKNLQNVHHPVIIDSNSYIGFNGITIAKISDHLNSELFTNSLVKVEYIQLTPKDELIITFDSPTTILALEFLCDNNSGYIQLDNGEQIIQKFTLKNDPFVTVKNKKMLSIITFNDKIFQHSNTLKISVIKHHKINKSLYDKERFSGDRNDTNINTTFKLSSLLITDNASISSIEHVRGDRSKTSALCMPSASSTASVESGPGKK